MWRNFLKQITKFLLIVVLVSPALLPSDAHAIYEGVREMEWNSGSKMCVNGGWDEKNKNHGASKLQFDPFSSNMDIEWQLDNGVCISYVASVMAAISAAGYATSFFCNQATLSAVTAASTASGVPLSPPMLIEQAKAAGTCSALLAAQNYVQAASCCGSIASYAAVVGGAVAALGIIYASSENTYEKARLCGHDWQTWQQDSTGNWVKGAYDGSYKARIQDGYTSGNFTADLSDYRYREYLFGGKEFADYSDSPSEICSNPWGKDRRQQLLGYKTNAQRYYMTGPGTAPVFACYRFLLARGTADEIASGKAAYDCCVKRSQNTMCIENALPTTSASNNYYGERNGGSNGQYDYRFCQMGSRCNVKGVWFDIYPSQRQSNYACAKTYSVCPYNHPLGGGTEIASYDGDDKSAIVNSCQYMKHCSKLPIAPYVGHNTLDSGYIDSSCKDMKGDSQNVYGYSADLAVVGGSARGFSSPMAQCFKETMENIFFNTAGSTACADITESPAADGTCKSGYKYQKGQSLSDYKKSIGQSGDSFFLVIQNKLQGAIKMALSIAIMFLGMSVLIGGSPVSKKQLLSFVVKIAVVVYFAIGDAWQMQFLNGILGSSAELSSMMFQLPSSDDPSKLDGCQFPKFNYADTNSATKYNNPAYPEGKEYLQIWDTLDCKIGRALGYGVEVSVPNFFMMLLAGLVTGGLGVIFFVASLMFAFFMISLTLRALHIFILSTSSIVILFYLSPITITAAMFAKTKGIFDKWWKNVLSFALQPVILFAYLGILISLFDLVIIGDVTFTGDGKNSPKSIVCTGESANTSIYCIFNQPISGSGGAIKTYNGLKMLGIGLPVLAELNQAKVSAMIKAAFIFFILTQFMDKIGDLGKTLTGGDVKLPAAGMKMGAMAQHAYNMTQGLQKRAVRAAWKGSGAAAAKGGEAVKGVARMAGLSGRGGAGAAEVQSSHVNNITGGDSMGGSKSTSGGDSSSKGSVSGSDSSKGNISGSGSGADSSNTSGSGRK